MALIKGMDKTEELYQELCSGLFVISGPCVIENEETVMYLAEHIAEICQRVGITYVFKASFDKANRTSVDSFRGPGMEEGLRILEKVKQSFGLPITTDVHETAQVAAVAEVVDIVQIPAFLCRQTDLLVAAGESGKIVNVTKGQFLAGQDMRYPAEKVASTGNKKIMLTERGNSFGYANLVVDLRNLVEMRAFGYPVVMDVTHSTQKPGGLGGKSGGNRAMAPYISAAVAAVGVDGFFFEVHHEPEKALSDGPNMVRLEDFEGILRNCQALHQATNLC